jgi:hypothetical protein
LKLPKNAPGATLRLNLESADYKIYSIEIVDPDGAPVFKSGGLKPRRKLLDVYVPAAKLAPGDYLVRLSARNAAGETDSVADYSFRVSQK